MDGPARAATSILEAPASVGGAPCSGCARRRRLLLYGQSLPPTEAAYRTLDAGELVQRSCATWSLHAVPSGRSVIQVSTSLPASIR
jgi:hypothetical protein